LKESRHLAKFNYKDHPVVVIAMAVGATIALCFAVLIPLHSMVVETKQATIDSLKDENETLRRRLQGDVVLV
jgi:hypothetical protein